MYIVIVNSYSGKRSYNKINDHLEKQLHTPFVTYFSHEYQEEDMWIAVHKKIDEIKHELNGFIVVGGDGTFHHVVQHLHSYFLPFGLIPKGSGNDFGRSLQIPKNMKKAIERINQKQPIEYDLIEVNNEKVLSVVGVGVDAETAIHCQTSRMKYLLNRALLGRLTYLMVFLRTVIHYKPIDVNVTDQNGSNYSFRRVWLMAAGNTNYYGGGIPICPLADPQDGKIDLVIVHGLNLFQLIVALPTVFIKKHLSLSYISMLRGEVFEITSPITQAVQGDGEEIGTTPAKIKILPKSIRVY